HAGCGGPRTRARCRPPSTAVALHRHGLWSAHGGCSRTAVSGTWTSPCSLNLLSDGHTPAELIEKVQDDNDRILPLQGLGRERHEHRHALAIRSEIEHAGSAHVRRPYPRSLRNE